MSANGTDRLQVKKIVWTMKNLIPKGDKKLEINSELTQKLQNKIPKQA